MMSTKNWYEII